MHTYMLYTTMIIMTRAGEQLRLEYLQAQLVCGRW